MKIGVVIAAYLPSAKHWQCLINRSIHSIIEQTRPPDNLVVVLNGSDSWPSDVSLKNVVGSIQHTVTQNLTRTKLSILHDKRKIGCAAARNKGFNEIKNDIDYVAWLDVDDRYHPEKLNIQEQAIRQHPEIDVLSTSFYLCNVAMNGLTVSGNDPNETDTQQKIVDKLKSCNPINGASTLISTKVFESLGGFNQKNVPGEVWPEYNKEMWEDWDLWIRATKLNYQIAVLPQRLYYWWHEMTVSREF